VTYNIIKSRLADLLYKITSMKFEDPAEGEEALSAKFDALTLEIKESFRALEEEFR
jgi:V-type H+-transporting ATPase subunit A